MNYTKQQLVEQLKDNICEVTFKKVSTGELRVMPCTLNESLIPKKPEKVHTTNTDNPVDFPKERKENPNVVSVWCTDKQEWRSFRLDTVTDFKLL